MMIELEEKRLTDLELGIYVFLGLEAVGIIVLAFWNLMVRSSWQETFNAIGASLPPITSLVSSTAGSLAAVCIGALLLYVLKTQASHRRTKGLVVFLFFGFIGLLLEILAFYSPYWALDQPLV